MQTAPKISGGTDDFWVLQRHEEDAWLLGDFSFTDDGIRATLIEPLDTFRADEIIKWIMLTIKTPAYHYMNGLSLEKRSVKRKTLRHLDMVDPAIMNLNIDFVTRFPKPLFTLEISFTKIWRIL